MSAEANAVVDRFFASIEAGDADGVRRCYADNARVWHNFDQINMTPEQNVATLHDYFLDFPTRKYTQARRSYASSDVVIQQHVLHLVRKDGREVDWPGCIVFRLTGDKITELDEYVDLSSLMQKLA
jgi:ketosteroid isomerase-like protein